jgi:capsid protein
LERDNDYARRFFKLLENNVLGATGVGLQMKCEDSLSNGDSKPDARANKLIERAWVEWGKRKNCTRDKRSGWITFQRSVLRATARDGTAIVRIHRDALNNE